MKAELEVNPRNAVNASALAVYLGKVGEHRAALNQLHTAEALAPNDLNVTFRAGVVHALAGRSDAAIAALERAVAGGLDATTIENEEDFKTLRRLPAFQRLIKPQP